MNRALLVCVLCGCGVSMPKGTTGSGGWGGDSGGGQLGGGTGFGGDGGGEGGGGFGDGGGCAFGPSQDNDPVVTPTTPPPAISGGTLAVMSDGTIVAADSDRDLVWLVNGTTVRQVALTKGSEPGRVVEGPAGHAFVALRRAGSIVDLNVTAGTIAAGGAVCSAPRGLSWSAASSQLTVACAGGELVQLSQALVVQSTKHVADDLRDVVAVDDGLLLTTFRQAHVLHVDAIGNVKALTDDTAFIPSEQPLDHPNFDAGGDFFDVDAGGGDSFDFGDAGVPDFADAGPTPPPPSPSFNRSIAWRMVAAPHGALLVHQRAQASQVTLLGSACTSFGGYGSSGDLTFGTVHTTLDLVADGGVSTLDGAGIEHDMVLAVDVALSAGGRVALVAAGNEVVDLFPLSAPLNGTRDFLFSGRPTAVAFRGEDAVVFVRDPAKLRIYDGTTGNISEVMLGGAAVTSTGHELFHRATPSQIACASCHPEAGDDAHVWQLPEGLRRTPSLRGGLSGTAPFHWSGNEADMGALLTDVFVSRMSGPSETPARTQALLDWLDAQGVLPTPPPADAMQVARGQATFAARCASCHAGAQGTNNTTVDVGTDGMFQVPRLHELWYRAPFMHDGRALTLEDRFGPAGGSNHGDTGTLSANDLADLLAYLRAR